VVGDLTNHEAQTGRILLLGLADFVAIDDGKRPLTRPAAAGEGAVAGHPLPKGEGASFLLSDYLIITPHATRGPALPAGSVFPSSGLAWITSAVPPS